MIKVMFQNKEFNTYIGLRSVGICASFRTFAPLVFEFGVYTAFFPFCNPFKMSRVGIM